MRKLTLAKETLRTLDDEDLARVVGGHGPSGHPNSGSHGGSCPAKHHHKKEKHHHKKQKHHHTGSF